MSCTAVTLCRSFSHCASSVSCSSFKCSISFSIMLRRVLACFVSSFCRLSRSISSCITLRSIRSTFSGLLVISTRSLAADSSIRSMALSGRKRPAMYLEESTQAEMRAVSRMRTPWCCSYLSLIPRRIDTESSTLASPTYTCWKRRSKAESFSMYLRYSASVVAPMQRSSPRARTGLSRLAASIPPSLPALPAPSTMWISSMKRMRFPSDSDTSSSTILRRSSNSPWSLAPAMRAPMSRLMMRQPCSTEGTSPATMRAASPSTMAVLPTPGSPMRAGLFLERRASTRITREISSSRPITGSTLPSRTSCTRSVLNWARPSGAALGLSVKRRLVLRPFSTAALTDCRVMLEPCSVVPTSVSDTTAMRSWSAATRESPTAAESSWALWSTRLRGGFGVTLVGGLCTILGWRFIIAVSSESAEGTSAPHVLRICCTSPWRSESSAAARCTTEHSLCPRLAATVTALLMISADASVNCTLP
mmetsp:Transcript_51035/g.124337  ORF Transcript_51035/g.124337 Transcript_51035/m.124337 type:complete len:477 (-) Transcript_51035:666-2096(-)